MDSQNTGVRRAPEVELGGRYFTPEQANRSLVLVRRIVADILDHYQRVLDHQELLERVQRRNEHGEIRRQQEEVARSVGRLQACADELNELGVEIRDWAGGVVDFPCILEGCERLLCWQYGEEQIAHWHETEEGCSLRRSLSELLPTKAQ